MPRLSPVTVAQRLFRVLLLLVLTLGWVGVSIAAETAAESAAAPVKPVLTADPAAIARDVQEFRRLVTDLSADAMEGRGPGTKGLDLARDYLVDEFRKIGLQPAFRATGDAQAEPSFIEAFEINAGVRATKAEFELVDANGKRVLKTALSDKFQPRGFSGSGSLEGDAVFVGYGIVNEDRKYDSYNGVDKDALKGKIVVAYRYEPMTAEGKTQWIENAKFGQWSGASSLLEKAKWAKEHGAAALVIVNPPVPDGDSIVPSLASTQANQTAALPVVQISRDVFYAMLRQAGQGDASVAKRLQKQADQGDTKLIPLEGVSVRGTVQVERIKATVHNVAGVLAGEGKLKDQYIVIGAHYDHLGYGDAGSLAGGVHAIHHGADDNASGTAGVVMLARRFVELMNGPGQPAGPQDRRSLLFVGFTGEERGLLGSAYMVKHLDELGIKSEQIIAMLNMDMIGRMRDRKLIAVGVGSGDKLESLLKDAAKGMADLDLSISASSVGGSDHMSFHMREIPAIHFYTGVHSDYHRPSDTADKVNVQGGVTTVNLLANMISLMWQSEEKIAFQKVKMAHPTTGGGGTGAFLGIVPNYASIDGDEGCAIDGVSDGSPAAQAGLKGGDVIVAWDKKPIKNLQELSDALKACKPGQTVSLKVMREKKEVELNVKLGSR